MSATVTRLQLTVQVASAPEQSHLARELSYLKARNVRRLRRQLNEPPRDRLKWRRKAAELGPSNGGDWNDQPVLPDLPYDDLAS